MERGGRRAYFSSIIYHFIASRVPLRNNSKNIVMYSDGCCYQNRCAVLSNALVHLASKLNITIEQKYHEKGHTQMECDSMHSCIERELKNKEINVPADYVLVCRKARKHPRPYHVKYLDHTFFKDFSKPIIYRSIRPDITVGGPKVCHL